MVFRDKGWIGPQIHPISTYRPWWNTARGRIGELAQANRLEEAIELIERIGYANAWRLSSPEEFELNPPNGWTTLHYAAESPLATLSQIERLITLGTSCALRTLDTKETAYEIAKREARSREILAMEEQKFRTPPIVLVLEQPNLFIHADLPGYGGGFNIQMNDDNGFDIRLESYDAKERGDYIVRADGTWERV
ncbi:hypothetical protein ABW21_db0204725 [Orbilia brochopaga]|nr:hypothetical protein ABW21_db0204725 [Drechslerella brochopaga]